MPSLLLAIRLLVVSLLLQLSLPIWAGNGVSKDDLDAQKEQLQLKIDNNKELAQKDNDALGKRIDAVDKRVDDVNGRFSDLGTIITVALAALGLVGYSSATNKAKEEARNASAAWFKENAQTLTAQIEALKQATEHAHTEIDASAEEVRSHADEQKIQMTEITNKLQKGVGAAGESLSPQENELLQAQAKQSENKPESSYSFDDWNTRAFQALHARHLEDAALYWKKAAKVPSAGIANAARALYNRGVALSEMGRQDEALGTYNHLIQTYSSDSTPAIREQVAKAMVNKGVALEKLQRHDEELDTCNLLIQSYASDNTPAIREQVAKAMFNKGVALGNMQRYDEVLDTYTHLIQTYASNNTPAMRELVAKAMVNKSVALGNMQRHDEALNIFNHLIQSYASDSTPAIREQVAKAMVNKGVALGNMQRYDEALNTFNHLIQSYASDSTPAMRELVAKAMLNKGVTLGNMQRQDEALDTYNQLIQTYASNSTPAIRELVATAMLNKGVTLGNMQRHSEALDTHNQLIQTYTSDNNPAIRELVATAMLNKGVTLGNMQRHSEALDTYNQLIQTYANDNTPVIPEQVTIARNGRAFTYLLQAKQHIAQQQPELATIKLTQANTDLQAALGEKSLWGVALGNLAYVQFLRGELAQAEQSFRSALNGTEEGGEWLYNATLDDIAQHPIPQDVEFKAMVERLWAEYQSVQPSQPNLLANKDG